MNEKEQATKSLKSKVDSEDYALIQEELSIPPETWARWTAIIQRAGYEIVQRGIDNPEFGIRYFTNLWLYESLKEKGVLDLRARSIVNGLRSEFDRCTTKEYCDKAKQALKDAIQEKSLELPPVSQLPEKKEEAEEQPESVVMRS